MMNHLGHLCDLPRVTPQAKDGEGATAHFLGINKREENIDKALLTAYQSSNAGKGDTEQAG